MDRQSFVDNVFNPITVFDNYEIIENRQGAFAITVSVTPSACNLYGITHGGFLFAMCDSVAGGAAFTEGSHPVTLESSINYIQKAEVGDQLTVRGECLHSGGRTRVVRVDITNQNGELVSTGLFTMYAVRD